MNSITDVGAIRVGHYQRLDPDASLGAGWACGVTVVLTPPGTVGAVDCRGGAPGTRETDVLDPASTVRFVDAVLLAGGSAYGLAAADGVMRWLEEQERGLAMDGGVVPIVPSAVIEPTATARTRPCRTRRRSPGSGLAQEPARRRYTRPVKSSIIDEAAPKRTWASKPAANVYSAVSAAIGATSAYWSPPRTFPSIACWIPLRARLTS